MMKSMYIVITTMIAPRTYIIMKILPIEVGPPVSYPVEGESAGT